MVIQNRKKILQYKDDSESNNADDIVKKEKSCSK